ncbi:MAG: YkgJ family cysteine cluster protein [Campylobacterales bacterium]
MVQREGFRFRFNPEKCQECRGKCCIGASGYIWVTEEEGERIAQFLNLPFSQFAEKFLKRVGNRFTLIEYRLGYNNYSCIFFEPATGRCKIYPVRPTQCREFPFWEQFKENPEEVVVQCPGVELF